MTSTSFRGMGGLERGYNLSFASNSIFASGRWPRSPTPASNLRLKVTFTVVALAELVLQVRSTAGASWESANAPQPGGSAMSKYWSRSGEF